MDISKCFRESLGIGDNKSRLYFKSIATFSYLSQKTLVVGPHLMRHFKQVPTLYVFEEK